MSKYRVERKRRIIFHKYLVQNSKITVQNLVLWAKRLELHSVYGCQKIAAVRKKFKIIIINNFINKSRNIQAKLYGFQIKFIEKGKYLSH